MFVGETEQEVRKRLVNVSGRPMSVGLCFTVAHEQFGIFHKTCYRNLVILCQESCRPQSSFLGKCCSITARYIGKCFIEHKLLLDFQMYIYIFKDSEVL